MIPCVISADCSDRLILYHPYNEGEGDFAEDVSENGPQRYY